MHNDGKHLWKKKTWEFPLIHNFEFTFGLSMEDTAKASTIVPWFFQDNALIDYETIKTHPDNADFAIDATPNVRKGSYIPKINVHWMAFIPPTDTTVSLLKFDTLEVGISMLNRLDAFDEKTGTDIEGILDLQHETTDQQTGGLYNGTKLFESQGARDLATSVPFLTTDGQLEGITFDKELFFDANHYYGNKEMLKSVTGRMRTHTVTEPIVPHGKAIAYGSSTIVPSMCKFQHPYTYCGTIFHLPQVDSLSQYHTASETTNVEHLTVKGFVRFNEFNDDFNLSAS